MSSLFVVFLFGFSLAQGFLQCEQEDGTPVDWYVLYKLPRIKASSNSLIRKGVAYAYITSRDVPKGWSLSTRSIKDPYSMPGRLLQPLYNTSLSFQVNSTLWIMYNDQPPNSSDSSELGHTKGVVISQEDGGLWLVHSVPHFPPAPRDAGGYSYPDTAFHYGQSFLCISLQASEMDLVGIQLTYNEPVIYDSIVPSDLEDNFPHLAAAARNVRVQTAPWYHEQELTSRQGQTFYSFAKARRFSKELYSDWVAPVLQTNLLVETWRNGRGKLTSRCNSTFIVENISSVKLKAASSAFKSTDDHSKWAVADKDSTSTKDWVCVGDINRMENQENRGGGTVCINHPKLWPSYRQLINGIEACPVAQKQ